MSPEKTDIVNFSQCKFPSNTSITINGQNLKFGPIVEFFVVAIDNYSSLKYHMEHIERVCLISTVSVTKLNFFIAFVLIRL